MVKRNPAVVIILSIITCGIYGIYWFVTVTNEIENALKSKDGSCSSGGMAFLFSLLSCGIYTYYWWYKEGQRVAALQRERNLPVNDQSVLYLILTIFGVGIINYALMQSDLNKIIDAPAVTPANTDAPRANSPFGADPFGSMPFQNGTPTQPTQPTPPPTWNGQQNGNTYGFMEGGMHSNPTPPPVQPYNVPPANDPFAAAPTSEPARFCANCGSKLAPGAQFCTNCGARNDVSNK